MTEANEPTRAEKAAIEISGTNDTRNPRVVFMSRTIDAHFPGYEKMREALKDLANRLEKPGYKRPEGMREIVAKAIAEAEK